MAYMYSVSILPLGFLFFLLTLIFSSGENRHCDLAEKSSDREVQPETARPYRKSPESYLV